MNTLSYLLLKIASDEPLTGTEKQELKLQATQLEQASSLVNSWVRPGTSIPSFRNMQADGVIISTGDVILDDAGIFIKNNSEAAFSWGDPTNQRGVIYATSDATGTLGFINYVLGKGYRFIMKLVSGLSVNLRFYEDPIEADRTYLEQSSGAQGARFVMLGGSTGAGGMIDFRTEGTSGGATFMRMRETPTTPGNPGNADSFHMYMKGDKFIIQFNDGGTVRYKYLDMTGTGVTWQETTTAP